MSTVPPEPQGQQDMVPRSADREAVHKFLDFIFDGATEGFVEFRYFSAGPKPKSVSQPSYLELPILSERVTEEVLSHNGRRMIAVGPSPRFRVPPQGRTGRARDVLQVGCSWISINNDALPGGSMAVLRRINELPLKPSVVVNSGYSYQLYYVFDEFLRAGRLLSWEGVMQSLREVMRVRDAVDISRVLGLPGTLNFKGDRAAFSELCHDLSSWTRYPFTEVRDALEKIDRAKQTSITLPAHSGSATDELRRRGSSFNLLNHAGEILPPGYFLSEDGSVWHAPPAVDAGKKPAQPYKVSESPIRITRIQEDLDTGQISVQIGFEYLERARYVTLARDRMASSRQLISVLAGAGAPVTSNNARHVLAYLAAYEHAFAATIPRRRITSRFGRGRSGGMFVFPGIFPEVEFVPRSLGDASLLGAYSSRKGTMAGWLEVMRLLVSEGLLIPQIAVLSAFVPPLQRRLQIPNFIIDLHGNTSTGKSTTLRLAASVYGRPHDPDSLILQWAYTQAALEQVAGMCSELPIFLDDAQHCPPDLKRYAVYMIGNGRGRMRGGSSGGIQEVLTWHTVALSTSEEPLYESSPHEGARGRILPLGGAAPPFKLGTAPLVQTLDRAVNLNHGNAGETYLRHLNGWNMADWSRWQSRYAEIRAEMLRGSTSNVAGRVSGYVAAIQLAAEVACPLLGLPFKPDIIGAWLMLHMEEQQSVQNQVLLALHALADYYVANILHFTGDGQHDPKKRSPLHGSSKQGQYVGFLRSVIESIFRSYKWSVTSVLNKMSEAGALHATESGRHTKKVGVAGAQHRMVCVKWSALFPHEQG
jgi:hypothetical protein